MFWISGATRPLTPWSILFSDGGLTNCRAGALTGLLGSASRGTFPGAEAINCAEELVYSLGGFREHGSRLA
jgi:hypothetical protein